MVSAADTDGAPTPQASGVGIRSRPQWSAARPRSPAVEFAWCIAALFLVAAPLPYLLRFDDTRGITAALIALTLFACSFYSSRGAIAATLVFLAVVGDYRRYASYFQGQPENDPLLLVAPVVALLLLAQSLLRAQSAPHTTLTRLVMALMALMVVEMFNPAQGGVHIGFAGALFYLAPLLWFWVARAFASLELAESFARRIVLGVGVAVVLLGIYQSYVGLLPFEQQWAVQAGYHRYQALYISDEVIRAFGFFGSSAEYQRYLIIVSASLAALWLAERSRAVLLLPLFLLAIFLSAARGPVVMVLLAMVVVWAVAPRNALTWLPRLVIAGGIGTATLIAALLALQASSLDGRVAPLVDRQVGGLLDPGNEEKSTAIGHLQLLRDGLLAGLANPAGEGLGATTEAAEKYGRPRINAEVDVANLMLSVGVLGGALYLAIVAVVLLRALKWWRISRHPYALVLLGTLVAALGGWLMGGEYSVVALVWFEIGLMDRLSCALR